MGSATLNPEVKRKKGSHSSKHSKNHARSRSESASVLPLANLNDSQGICNSNSRGWLDNAGMAPIKPSKSTDYYHHRKPSTLANSTAMHNDPIYETTTAATRTELLNTVSDADILKLTEMAVHLPDMSTSSQIRSAGSGRHTSSTSHKNHHGRKVKSTLRQSPQTSSNSKDQDKPLTSSSSILSIPNHQLSEGLFGSNSSNVDSSTGTAAGPITDSSQLLSHSYISSDHGSSNLSDDSGSVNHNIKRSSWNSNTANSPSGIHKGQQQEFSHPFLQHQPSSTFASQQELFATINDERDRDLGITEKDETPQQKQPTKEDKEEEHTFMFDYESLPKEVRALIDAYERKGKVTHRMMKVKYKKTQSDPAKLLLPVQQHSNDGVPKEPHYDDNAEEQNVVLLRDLLIGGEVADLDYKVNPVRDIAVLTTEASDNIHLTKLVQLKPSGSLLDIQVSLFNSKVTTDGAASENGHKEAEDFEGEDADEEDEVGTREDLTDILQVVEHRLASLESFKIESIDFLHDHLDTLESLHLYDRFSHAKHTIPYNHRKPNIPRTYSQPSLSTSSSATNTHTLSTEPEGYSNSLSRSSSISSLSSSATDEDGVILRPTRDLIHLHQYRSHGNGSQTSLLSQQQQQQQRQQQPTHNNNRQAQSMFIAGHHSVDDMQSRTITRDPFEERQFEIEQSIDSLSRELADFKIFLKHTEELVDDVQMDMNDFRTRMDTYIKDIPESHYSALKKLEVDIESILSKRAKNPYIDTGYTLLSYLLTIFALLVWIIICILKWCKRVVLFPYKLWRDYQEYLTERDRAVKRASMRTLSGDNLFSMAAMMTAATTARTNSGSGNSARRSHLGSHNGKRGSTSSNNSDHISFRSLSQRSPSALLANTNTSAAD